MEDDLERCADVKVDTEALQRLMEPEDEVCLRYILKYSTRGGKLGLLQYAAVVLDFQGSKSTSCGVIGVFGIQTHVPSALICKKQTALSHSSSQKDIISLDVGLRMEGTQHYCCRIVFEKHVRVMMLKGNFTRTSGSVVHWFTQLIACHSIWLTTFQATFQSQAFRFRRQRSSHSYDSTRSQSQFETHESRTRRSSCLQDNDCDYWYPLFFVFHKQYNADQVRIVPSSTLSHTSANIRQT